MHDAIACEKAGTPAVGVMTNRFIDAASLMARVLGMPDYPFAVISHPVSSASDSELRESAQGVMAVLPELIVGSIKQTVITS